MRKKISNSKIQIPNPSRGFTLLELILYVSIVSIVLTSLVTFAWNVIGGGAKSSFQQEVFSQGRLISERIKYEIRDATGINSVAASTISLVKSDAAKNPTVITLTSGKVTITQGSPGTTYDLNSNTTLVTGLTFTDYSSSSTKNIQYSFTIDDNYTGARQEYEVPAIVIQSSTELRKQ